MKKLQLFNWMLIAFMAFQFTSCDDEPLEGEFPQQETPGNNTPGSFTALVNGVSFTAAAAVATVNADGDFIITGVSGNNSAIVLTASPIGVNSYNLLLNSSNVDDSGIYVDVQSPTNPYTTQGSLGGNGSMTVTVYDDVELLITGSFEFVGVRPALDVNGDPIIDTNGDPIIQNVIITQGVFTDITFTLDGDPGDGDPGDGDPGDGDPVMVDEFFALVDGTEHVEETLTTTVNMVGDEMVFKIEAQTTTGALMRIDVPFDTGIGTFDMESDISDGTKLIGIYNPNIGGENLSSNPGTITFTQFDTVNGVMEATFSFTARDPLMQDSSQFEVTQGSFIVYFTGVPAPTLVPFKAVIDGADFDPSGIDDTVVLSDEEVNGVNIKYVTAILSNGRTMKIGFPSDMIAVGTYPMSIEVVNGDETIGLYIREGSAIEFVSNPGTLVIQNYDEMTGDISATFSFTAVNPDGVDPTIIQITEGEFNLNLL
jgi:hypothetical protein